ncbi:MULTISPECIES: TIGR00730 family Rossman fold protein [unclassified Oceanobacter]|uniref:LOG family protein n=2 Tax=Gammaproteobacteria TaxID=1236 RepID=UPI0027323C85|nr:MULTISPECIES: TIGR00730 family Rossman fold protein [unclassified Oceanobacter]MDP2548944.1 TIGR00730 family Rossman fold protein [Oceanobacter sp. 4_MG-2023]MDP2609672.1 TIGR00730 family Rossman fold protein [Oceanobacter sp. 1_MG-2023]MDP2613390.1 TIGR00730 family Rossman fold protein [Oceanobacter sp. 2_MG-2023]
MIKRVAIYCGSRLGNDPAYAAAATTLATFLAQQGIGIVYGGSQSGLMGIVANAALAAGGEVIGVMPGVLGQQEKIHTGLTQIHHVHSMHERKALMADLADAFVALPGGIGTLDELVEVWCWANIGDHNKPCACFDVDQFWQPFFDLLTHIRQQGFAHQSGELLRASEPALLLQQLEHYALAGSGSEAGSSSK